MPSAGDVRAVVDTNVLLSGLFGKPHALVEQVRAGALSLISSPGFLADLAEVMTRPKFEEILARSTTDARRTLDEVRRLAETIDPPPLPASGQPRSLGRRGAGSRGRIASRSDHHRR